MRRSLHESGTAVTVSRFDLLNLDRVTLASRGSKIEGMYSLHRGCFR